MSVTSFASQFQTPEFVSALRALVLSSKYLYRDAILCRDEVGFYRVGAFFRESSMFDCTFRFGGIVGEARFVVISSSPRDASALSQRPEWGLTILGPGELFKVVDVQTLKGKTQVTIVHVPAAFEAYFRSPDAWLFEKWTVPQAQEDFETAVGMDAIKEHLEEDWRRRVQRPPGMSVERRLITV